MQQESGQKHDVSCATIDDCAFIAQGTLNAERGHLNYGMWDFMFNGGITSDNKISDEMIMKCLQKSVETIESSILFYKNFFIARSTTTGESVGTLSVWNSPVSLHSTIDSMKDIMQSILGWNEEQYNESKKRLNFLLDASGWKDVPEEIFDNTLYIETMYVCRSHRGQNIASSLLDVCINEAKKPKYDASRIFLMCAVGNDKAKKLYEKHGLSVVAYHNHADTYEALGISGFHIMTMDLEK